MDRVSLTPPKVAPADIPDGYCGCRCGAKTSLAKSSDSRTGRVKGAPLRYVAGHYRRRPVRYVVAQTGFTSPCWIWALARDRNGYGVVANGRGGCTSAHIVYYEQAKGPIPEGLQIDHLCRMPACVNPEHLEAVTPAENVRRGRRAKLTAEQVAEIRASADTQMVLARRYGISQPQVSRIKCGKTWRGVSASRVSHANARVRHRGAERSQQALVPNALRLRPERIVVGEVRGAEALDRTWVSTQSWRASAGAGNADG